ncbi:hypothetical protein [Aequorivita marina]|uniref:hypothetical protein n=1 Tax=Aequorivita marina TaxID=3073654 RepID=UPI002873FA96|nr:hypothetical protein [Aequorivita sp. S2608]MDS1298561.1 hypothetical protein [Aequorivita sp. S2608]
MLKNLVVFGFLLVSVYASAQSLAETRTQYPEAVKNSEVATKLDEELTDVKLTDKPVLAAYKGAALTLKAKFAKGIKHKKEFFKEGVSFIEAAVKADSTNIEIRYLRMSVQENSPKILGYHKDVAEDKAFILKNYSVVSSRNLKDAVKKFVLNSDNFDASEKEKFLN